MGIAQLKPRNLLKVHSNDFYDLILHPHDRGASCLDGSPAGLYIREDVVENKKKFMLYFEGGAVCGSDTVESTLESCYQRSFTDLGSTNPYPKQKNFEK